MSSNIFKIKVIDSKTRSIDAKELINYCFDIPDLDFDIPEYLDTLSIKLDKGESPWKLSLERFLELLQSNYKINGNDFFAPLKEIYADEFLHLQKDYDKTPELIRPEALIWNNILATLNVENFKTRPVFELTIEIAQDQDGIVAFPSHRGLGIKSIVYREFMIRVLSDIQSEIPNSKTNITNWFKDKDGIMHPEYPNRMKLDKLNVDFGCDEGIVWGIEEIEKITIDLDQPEFWKEYPNAWWKDRMKSNFEYWAKNDSKWIENNKEYPFTIAKYSILIHPSWFGENVLLTSDKIFDSTAYGY